MKAGKIGILTGGGDVPGLNAVIKTVVYRGVDLGRQVVGIRRGWEGLTHLNLEDSASAERYVRPLDKVITRNIDRTGGTWLHSSRTNPLKMKKVPDFLKEVSFQSSEAVKDGVKSTVYDMTPQVMKNIEKLGIEYLVAIGGDDTLSYAAHLDRQGVRVVAVPKTMDNDVQDTEYCIGFSTAVTRATDAIDRQRTTIGSHERIGVFRIFGRDAGYTALYTAYVNSMHCVIPEYKVDVDKLIAMLIENKKSNPSAYSLVLLSEGAQWVGYEVQEYGRPDGYGHRKKMNIAEILADKIQEDAHEETIVSDLTYDLRSGAPDFVDRLVANTFAGMAVDLIARAEHGQMMAISQGCYKAVPIPDPKRGPRKLDVEAMYNKERYRPNYSDKLGFPIFLTRA